jgi:dTDP-4-dehydrorhamnose reductase
LTWYELACRVAELAGLDHAAIEPRTAAAVGWTAPRPAYSALASERGQMLAPLDDALARYLATCGAGVRQVAIGVA